MANIGEHAPDFLGKLTNGNDVKDFRLSVYLGKENIVLAFIFGCFTGVCTAEMCAFRDSLKEFENLGAKVYGISVDTPYTQNAFIKANALTTEMVSDFNKEAIRAFGVVHEEINGLKGMPKRSVFIIGKDGKIKYKWVSEVPKNPPNFDELKSELKKLH